jgi:hypothetical protein
MAEILTSLHGKKIGLDANGNLVVGGVRLNTNKQTVAAGSAITMTEEKHSGKTILLDTLTGSTATLPPATGSGAEYRFRVSLAPTSNGHVIACNGTDTFIGQVTITLAAGGTTFGESAAGTDDKLTMNGTTSGGIIGSYVVVTDVAAGVMLLDARLLGSSTLATTGLLTAS